MGEFVANAIIKKLILANKIVRSAKVVILGVTFKENCPDIRNSKVADIISKLKEYGVEPVLVDPWAKEEEVRQEYGYSMTPLSEVQNADCLVFAVSHSVFSELSLDQIDKMYAPGSNDEKVFVDVKGIFPRDEIQKSGYQFWRL
jgi:UDP-N-acetyl-D-galactosamine dehydrogenase